MALTFTSATLLPGPSWDETIVPALRKRLESESRTLSKRMSAISATSVEAFSAPYVLSPTDTIPSPPYTPKASAIPRPSTHQTRASADSRPEFNGPSRPNGTPPVKPRPRTNSNPSRPNHRAIDAKPHTNGVVVVPPPDSPLSTSSYTGRASDIKPTRIPKVALGRNPSLSSHSHFPASHLNPIIHEGRNGYGSYTPPTPEPPPHLRMLEGSLHSSHSHSIGSIGSHHLPGLLHEPPPFKSGSISSTTHSWDYSQEDDAVIGRTSTDSEERPFEHWYRGEVSRNGGVGELRVGKRQEMLDIANYGHSIRKVTPHLPPRGLPPADDTPWRRKRADSVAGIGERESFYLDEERAKQVARVLDEGPLTDLEADEDSDYSMRHEVMSARSISRSETPTHRHPSPLGQNLPPTRIPSLAPSRQSSEPPRIPSSIPPKRGSSEPPSFHSTPSQLQEQTSKRRAKSPTTPTSASKRSKATALSIASKRAAEDHKNRLSIAHYPSPEDGIDVVNAIPSWTEPIPPSGNWDEVVLPVVARKRGLEGQYEKADGSFQFRKPSDPVKPAPGTFRFDPSKYRIPAAEDIPMDEFGLPLDHNTEDDEPRDGARLPVRTPSPPPFSRYRPDGKTDEDTERGGRQAAEEREDAGCCKCVIM